VFCLSEVTITDAVEEYVTATLVGAGAPPPPPPNASTRRFLCVILAVLALPVTPDCEEMYIPGWELFENVSVDEPSDLKRS